jgi:RNA polymerase sigma factor (sigma-70 family)
MPLSELNEVVVNPEELETLRLRYIKELSQDEAAKKMGISQSQYQRDLVNTLKKITKALISGDAISIPDRNK